MKKDYGQSFQTRQRRRDELIARVTHRRCWAMNNLRYIFPLMLKWKAEMVVEERSQPQKG